MIVIIITEVIFSLRIIITTIFINQVLLLVMILAKFSWDCVVYHRTGQTNIIFGNNCSTSLLPQVNYHGWLESFAGASQESREPVGQTQPCGVPPHPQILSAKSPVWSQASPVQEGEMSTFEHTAILTHLHWAQQILALSPWGPCPGCAGAVRPGWRGAALATSPPPTPATGGEWKCTILSMFGEGQYSQEGDSIQLCTGTTQSVKTK